MRGAIYAGIGTVVALVVGVARWAATRWWVTPEAIHFRRGILGRSETDVPLGRIQALDLEQGLVQRLFGVHAVHVQTGGGGAGGEIVLEALGDAEIDELRRIVAVPAPASSDAPELRMRPRMLLLAALTAGQLGVILPVLAGAFQLLDNVIGDPTDDAVRLLPDTLLGLVAGAHRPGAGRVAAVGDRGGRRLLELHAHARRRPAADPPRPGGAARGHGAGGARARRRGRRGAAAAPVRARHPADGGDRPRRRAERRQDAVPARAAGRGARVAGPLPARAGRRPRRPGAPAGACPAPLRAAPRWR